MSKSNTSLPILAEILGPILRRISFEQRPLLLAAAERLAANRYRQWGNQVDPALKPGMLACADREDEVARRIEAMFPNAVSLQKELLAQAPELSAASNLFTSLSLRDQFALQAQGERAGAATWRVYAEKSTNAMLRTEFLECALLEEESAMFLESIVRTG